MKEKYSYLFINPAHPGAQAKKFLIKIFIAAVQMIHTVDLRRA
jgi:hypothetical protein